MQASRVCVFCGGTPVTQEHVFPQWLGQLFTDEVVDFELTIESANGESNSRPWQGRPFSTTVGGPCKSCNSGWMSDLEDQAAPLLRPLVRGQTAGLDADQQTVLATWASKTMLMLLLAGVEDAARELAPGAYEYLRLHQQPPPSEEVWLAHYAGEGQWPASSHYFAIGMAAPGDAEPDGPNAHAASFSVGHAAFALTGHQLSDGPTAIPSLPADTRRRLWPAYGPEIDFPPPASLAGDSEMRSFALPASWEGPASSG